MESSDHPTLSADGSQTIPRGSRVVQSVLIGCAGFSIVSIGAFSVWAFGGRFLGNHFGELGMFAACLLVFLALSGLLLFRLVPGPNRLARFYRLFLPAFFAYAAVWCAAWYAFKFGLGEWLGSLLGSIAFAAITAKGLGRCTDFAKVCAVLFVCHSAGYFLGGQFMRWAAHATSLAGLPKSTLFRVGELGWGAIYGAGFGAGIGFVFHAFQRDTDKPESL